MFLSRVILNPEHPHALRALANPYQLHQLLWQAFPHREDGGAGRVLFRVEAQRRIPAPEVLVQSDLSPDWSVLASVTLKVESRPFTPKFAVGQMLRFRVCANPTKRLMAGCPGEKVDGKRVQLFFKEDLVAWFQHKAASAGFSLIDCRISSVERLVSRKESGKPITHQAVTYEGLLQVTDPALFKETLAAGIGPGKGFGFGLLSLARA